jgi:hypothetical protein
MRRKTDRETLKRRLCVLAALLAMLLVSVERACVPDSEQYRGLLTPLLTTEAAATTH